MKYLAPTRNETSRVHHPTSFPPPPCEPLSHKTSEMAARDNPISPPETRPVCELVSPGTSAHSCCSRRVRTNVCRRQAHTQTPHTSSSSSALFHFALTLKGRCHGCRFPQCRSFLSDKAEYFHCKTLQETVP